MIINKSTTVNFICDENTPSGIKKIAAKVAKDIELVTDAKTTFSGEKSDGIDIYFGIDSSVTGEKREVYLFEPVTAENRINIYGSDKRGTIYGLFHISDILNVSPMVNWSNVVPLKKEWEVTDADRFESKEPSVLYRGFFINDEWPCFGNWCTSHFGGFTAEMYEGVFELLLRMKGNYLWPAMWSSCFAEDGPGLASAILADELGVVMGLSHHEPCLRHGEEYSHVRGKDSIYGDAWNFLTNREGITRFWRDGLKRNGHLENVITMGMRGERDSKIMENATLKDNIDLIRDVLITQNQLIKEEVNPNLEEVPRMLALYKEVEPFYYGDESTEGLKTSPELDGVILLLCDDNHGYLRSLPDKEMRKHKGGFGMYYHFDYHGEPISYEWINSTYLPEVWEQMTTAYEHGVQSLWIVNVGDLGLNELPLEYFMDLAYDYDKYGIEHPNSTDEYTENMMRLQFAGAFAEEDISVLSDMYTRYTRLIHNRRPEHLNDSVYHPQNYYEGTLVLKEAEDIAKTCMGLLDKCPDEYRDSFIELIAYNVLAGTNLVSMWINRSFNHYYASIGAVAANEFGEMVQECLRYDDELREMLHTAADGKWYGFGMAEHIGFKHWNSEEAAYPVIETVIPVRRAELMVGLMGETKETSGQEWTKKDLVVHNYLDIEGDTARARLFAAITGEDVTFSISTDSEYVTVKADTDTVTKDDPITYMDVLVDKKAWENGISPELIVTYEIGKIKVILGPPNEDIYFCEADSFAKEVDTLKGEVFVLRDIGRRESGVKFLPVTEDMPGSAEGPYLDYEFDIKSAGEYSLIFQMMPTSAYTFGEKIRLTYAVNPAEDDSADIRTATVEPSTYEDKNVNSWWKGVLDHVRYINERVTLKEGRNIIRYYAASRENILERVILVKDGTCLPESYLGPR